MRAVAASVTWPRPGKQEGGWLWLIRDHSGVLALLGEPEGGWGPEPCSQDTGRLCTQDQMLSSSEPVTPRQPGLPPLSPALLTAAQRCMIPSVGPALLWGPATQAGTGVTPSGQRGRWSQVHC